MYSVTISSINSTESFKGCLTSLTKLREEQSFLKNSPKSIHDLPHCRRSIFNREATPHILVQNLSSALLFFLTFPCWSSLVFFCRLVAVGYHCSLWLWFMKAARRVVDPAISERLRAMSTIAARRIHNIQQQIAPPESIMSSKVSSSKTSNTATISCHALDTTVGILSRKYVYDNKNT